MAEERCSLSFSSVFSFCPSPRPRRLRHQGQFPQRILDWLLQIVPLSSVTLAVFEREPLSAVQSYKTQNVNIGAKKNKKNIVLVGVRKCASLATTYTGIETNATQALGGNGLFQGKIGGRERERGREREERERERERETRKVLYAMFLTFSFHKFWIST